MARDAVYDALEGDPLRNRFITACGVLGAALLAAQLARGGVQQKTLHSGNKGPVGIALDSEGRLHVSWQSVDLKLHYTRIERGKKLDQIVDALPACGYWSSIAVDSAGRPHIAYHAERGSDQILLYAHFDGAAWQIEEIGPGGYSTAIAIDADDHPHIVHGHFDGSFEYLHRDDSGWQHETPAGFTAKWTSQMSLVLDSAGHAHVGMQETVNGHPIYATNASGDWTAFELSGEFSAVVSLVLDSLEHPHVALPLSDTGTVRYSHFDGSQWLSEDLYDPNDLPPGAWSKPQAAALVLDAHDRPQIVFKGQIYLSSGASGDFVIYAYHDGADWRGTALTHHPASDWAQLAIDANGVGSGAYALSGRAFDTQVTKLVRVPLPDVSGDWASLALSEQGGKSRVDAVLAVRNEGALRSKSAQIALYLSDDAVLDPGDVPVAVHKSTGGVAPGSTKTVKLSFERTGSLAGLYLIAVLDPQGRIDDLDRSNDTIAGPLGN